jgi:hypothetical protein
MTGRTGIIATITITITITIMIGEIYALIPDL